MYPFDRVHTFMLSIIIPPVAHHTSSFSTNNERFILPVNFRFLA